MLLCGRLSAQSTVVIRVDPRCGNDSNSGALSDWSDAVASLVRAAQLASTVRASGAIPEIRLAASPVHLTISGFSPLPSDPRLAEIVVPAGTRVIGGFGGCSSLLPDELESVSATSIVSGLLTGVGSPEPAFRLFLVPSGGSGTTVFQGLTLREALGSCSTCEGAGIAAFSGDLEILSCHFDNLEADVRGGGLLYVNSAGNLLIDAVPSIGSSRSWFNRCKATSVFGLGGGAFVDAHQIRVNRARFEGCEADLRGGGMFAVVANADIGAEREVDTFDNAETSFQANGQTLEGAGLYFTASISVNIVGTHFGKNIALSMAGGAFISSPLIVIRRSYFQGSQDAPSVGGCVLSTTPIDGQINISRTRFESQRAGNSAGAIETRNGHVRLSHCSFRGSLATSPSDALTWRALSANSVQAVNCLFATESEAEDSSVASVQLKNCGDAIFSNCTFAANRESLGATWAISRVSNSISLAQTFVNNSIIWGYFDDSLNPADSTLNPFKFDINSVAPLVSFSDVQGPFFTGSNSNISLDPLFVDPFGSFRLQNTSPCIDVGSDALVSVDILDIDRDGIMTERIPWDLSITVFTLFLSPPPNVVLSPVPRLVGSPCFDLGVCPNTSVDMGAFEVFLVFCRVDWNGDNIVDTLDIFDFLNDWFLGMGDYNLDGLSETSDIFDYLNAWFTGHCKLGPGTITHN